MPWSKKMLEMIRRGNKQIKKSKGLIRQAETIAENAPELLQETRVLEKTHPLAKYGILTNDEKRLLRKARNRYSPTASSLEDLSKINQDEVINLRGNETFSHINPLTQAQPEAIVSDAKVKNVLDSIKNYPSSDINSNQIFRDVLQKGAHYRLGNVPPGWEEAVEKKAQDRFEQIRALMEKKKAE
jgi:hypothetical protein